MSSFTHLITRITRLRVRKRQAWRKLLLEALEERRTPAGQICTWVGLAADGNWSSPANWENQLRPTDGDIPTFVGGNAQANKDAIVDAAFAANVAEIRMLPGYPGDLTIQHNLGVSDRIVCSSGIVKVDQNVVLS
jgi:hypothetical protein